MEKFQTHAGPKTVDDILSEILKKPKPENANVLKAQAMVPGEIDPNEKIRLGPVDYSVSKASEPLWEQQLHASTATGPVGPSGLGPYAVPPGANGPAGPVSATGGTGASSTYESPGLSVVRERAEVDLRKAVRRCLKEGIPVDRMVEIFRLELVDVVHDE